MTSFASRALQSGFLRKLRPKNRGKEDRPITFTVFHLDRCGIVGAGSFLGSRRDFALVAVVTRKVRVFLVIYFFFEKKMLKSWPYYGGGNPDSNWNTSGVL